MMPSGLASAPAHPGGSKQESSRFNEVIRTLHCSAEPTLEDLPYLGSLHPPPYRIHHHKSRAVLPAPESHPIRNVNFFADRLGRNMHVPKPEKSGAEKYALHFGNDQSLCAGIIQQRRRAVASFHADNIIRPRQLLEVVEVKISVYGIEAEYALFPPPAVQYLHLEELEGNVEVRQ